MPLTITAEDKNFKKAIHEETLRLEALDTPLSNENEDERIILGVGTEQSLEQSVQTNYKKRALSYTHGAMLAVRYSLAPNQIMPLVRQISALYNNFENQAQLNTEALVAFLTGLNSLLKAHGITAENLRAGEKIANLERQRPAKLTATLSSNASTATISEIPKGSALHHPAVAKQYEFIDELNKQNNYREEMRLALDQYQNKYKVEQAFVKCLAGIGWVLERCGCSSNGFFSGIMSQLTLIRKKDQALNALATANAPKWFQKQNRIVQEYFLSRKDKDKENMPALPATLRGIPGLPNMSVHKAHFPGSHPVSHSVIRHGTLTPYEMKEWNEREAAALANGEALAVLVKSEAEKNYAEFWTEAARNSLNFKHKKIPVADTSFMSPTHGEAAAGGLKKRIWGRNKGESIFLERYSSIKIMCESNRAMKLENRAAYLHGIAKVNTDSHLTPSSTNLGVNGDRWMFSTSFRSQTYQDQIQLNLDNFESLEKSVEALRATGESPFCKDENENKYQLALLAKTDLKIMAAKFKKSYFMNMFSTEADISERINAELFASCLNALLIQGMGGTVSACCKSSKDRTGLFLLHLDAMHQYFAETGKLISYKADETSEERKAFVEIMADLYIKNIQQTMASQTTYGAFGLKEPNGISGDVGLGAVPPDLEEAIERKAPGLLAAQEDLAGTNKVKF